MLFVGIDYFRWALRERRCLGCVMVRGPGIEDGGDQTDYHGPPPTAGQNPATVNPFTR